MRTQPTAFSPACLGDSFLVSCIPWASTLATMYPDRSMVTGTEQKTSLKQVLVLEFESEFKLLFQGFLSVETVVFWIWASCLQHWALRLIHFRLIKFCSSCSLPVCWHIVLCWSSRSRQGSSQLAMGHWKAIAEKEKARYSLLYEEEPRRF